jgi:hypothetical protein
MLGATNGPCAFISGCLIFRRYTIYNDNFDLTLSISILLLGVFLCLLSWIKGAQEVQYVVEYEDQLLYFETAPK